MFSSNNSITAKQSISVSLSALIIMQNITFRFALSENCYIFSFGNLQEVEHRILSNHPSEVHVIHLTQGITRNTIKQIHYNRLHYKVRHPSVKLDS